MMLVMVAAPSVTDPQPLASWAMAFGSEIGLRTRHNIRAFLPGAGRHGEHRRGGRDPALLNPGLESLKVCNLAFKPVP